MTNAENYKSTINKRCMTCKHWQGDREKAIEQLNVIEKTAKIHDFLDVENTWCDDGDCRELRLRQYLYNADSFSETLVDAVFGCVLHKFYIED